MTPHGNFMRYHYANVTDSGLAAGTVPGRNIYVKKITYTGSGGTEGRYAVTFTRDRELGEPLRADKSIDARGGFKRVTADLLRRIEVTLDSDLVRRYDFAYTTGAFLKTLLDSVTQFDADGAAFNTHEFSYYDDIRDGSGAYQAFDPLSWTSPSDGLGTSALNLTPEQAGNASALNSVTSVGGGGHLYVGVGTSPTKSNSVGVKVGFNDHDGGGPAGADRRGRRHATGQGLPRRRLGEVPQEPVRANGSGEFLLPGAAAEPAWDPR